VKKSGQTKRQRNKRRALYSVCPKQNIQCNSLFLQARGTMHAHEI